MKLPFLICLPLLVAAGIAQAQAPVGQEGAAGQANLAALSKGSMAVLPRGESDGTIGSPYADRRWLLAQLTLRTNRPLAPVPLKYDVLGHRLLMRPLHRTDSLQLDDHDVTRFALQEPASALGPARTRVFRRFTEAPYAKNQADYVEVLYEGRHSLLKHYSKTLNRADFQGAYSANRRYDEIEERTVYYVCTPEGTIAPVKLALKPLQTAAPILAAELKAAADAQKPKTEADWAAVLAAAQSAIK